MRDQLKQYFNFFLITFFSLVFLLQGVIASGYHVANEIYPGDSGEFQSGDYVFTGNLDVTSQTTSNEFCLNGYCLSNWTNGGDIFSVTAGEGLIGGGTSGAVNLDIDNTTVQLRISTTCPSGSSIRAINLDGSVDCEIDDNSGNINGSGTDNYLSKWSGSNDLSNSIIYDDGTNVGIGTSSPNYKLTISDNALARTQFVSSSNTGATITDGTWIGLNGQAFEIRQQEASDINFYTNGLNRVTFDDIGRVGIGTTSPNVELDVDGQIYVGDNDRVKLWECAAGGGCFAIDDNTSTRVVQLRGDSAVNYINNGGNFGIGTTSPNFGLDVEATSAFRSTSSQIRLKETDAVDPEDSWHFSVNGEKLLFIHEDNSAGPAYTNPMSLDTNGYVGIGITSPDKVLHVSTVDGSYINNRIIIEETNSPRQNWIGLDGDADQFAIAADEDNLGSDSELHFRVDGSQRMVIDSSGRVGIGTTSPLTQLELAGVDSKFITLNRTEINKKGHIGYGTANDGGVYLGTDDNQYSLWVQQNGNVGVGTTSPGSKLHISDATAKIYLEDENANSGEKVWKVQSDQGKFTVGRSTDAYSDAITTFNIDTNDNVGIGTTSPDYRLTVQANNAVHDGIMISNAGTGSPQIRFDAPEGTGLTTISSIEDDDSFRIYHASGDRLTIDSNGDVGIGTTTPDATLDVDGTLRTQNLYHNVLQVNVASATTTNGIKIKTNIPSLSNEFTSVIIEGYDYRGARPLGIILSWYGYTGGNTFYNYAASSFGGQTPTITLANESGLVVIHIDNDKTDQYYNMFNVRVFDKTLDASYFEGWSWADEAVTGTHAVTVPYINRVGNLYADGNVGIGTTSPTAKLQVKDDTGLIVQESVASRQINFVPPTSGTDAEIRIANTASGLLLKTESGGDQLFLAGDGTVGIGDKVPDGSLKLDVEGQIGATSICDQNGANCVAVTDLGSGINGSGTSNYLSKFSASETLTDSLIFDDGSNIGIGTSSPQSRLHVQGPISDNSGGLRFHTNNYPTTYGHRMYLVDSGSGGLYLRMENQRNSNWTETIRLGNGDNFANPSLRVLNGDAVFDYDVGIGTNNPQGRLHITGGTQDIIINGTGAGEYWQLQTGTDTFNIKDWSGTPILQLSGATNDVIIQNGNLGIGTTNPTTSLQVNSDISNLPLILNSGQTSVGLKLSTNGKDWDLFNSPGVSNQGFGIYDRNNSAYRFAIDGSSGNIGIGITSPESRLHVQSDVATNIIMERNATNDWAFLLSGGSLQIQDRNNGVRSVIDSSGNFGIGTITPTHKLSVLRTGMNGVGDAGVVEILTDASTINDGISLNFGARDSSASTHHYSSIRSDILDPTDGSEDGELQFWTANGGAQTKKMVITSTGSVGIGSGTPDNQLDVIGRIDFGDVDTASEKARLFRDSSYLHIQNLGDTYDVSVDGPFHVRTGGPGDGTDEFLVNAAGNVVISNTLSMSGGNIDLNNNDINNIDQLQIDLTSGVEIDATGAQNLNFNVDGEFYIDLDDNNDGSDSFYIRDGADTTIFSISESGTATISNSLTINGNAVWHAGNDGSGSTLDADTIDGIDSSTFLTSDIYVNTAGDIMTGDLNLGNNSINDISSLDIGNTFSNAKLEINTTTVISNPVGGNGYPIYGDAVQAGYYCSANELGDYVTHINSTTGGLRDFHKISDGTWIVNPSGSISTSVTCSGPKGIKVKGDSVFNGNIGIGITSPDELLHVNGSAIFEDNVTAVAYYYSSDERLKNNINALDSSLDKIKKLNGVSFNWNKNGNSDIGLIAQNIEKVYPELVKTDSNGFKSVKYGNLVAPLIEAVKQQQNQIEEQNNKLQTQEELILDLIQRVENLEND